MATSRTKDRARRAGQPADGEYGGNRLPRGKKLIPTPPDKERPVKARSSRTDIGEPEGIDLLKICQDAETISRDFHTSHLARPLARAYRAWRNEHAEGSKYLGPGFRARSRLFVPKTRTAVRKNMAAAASALFSTDDVANVQAVYEDDPVQLASAAVKKELLNYRLSRGWGPTSINWFHIAMGGVQDSQLAGAVVSKQYWDYQKVEAGTEKVELDVVDEITGEVIGQVTQDRPVYKVIVDRPMIDLLAMENCSIDPAAPWFDPVGIGKWFFARYPMYVSDAKAMLAGGGQEQGWLDHDTIDWSKGRDEDTQRSATRRSREGGRDRYNDSRVGDHDIIWIVERFLRIEGRDLHFWTLGETEFISEVRDTDEVYPAFNGERPYKMGVASIDTHRVIPMSPVESWQPLQLELNDVTNLRLDTLKRSIAPLAVVKRGAKVDLGAMQRRGQPEAVLQVNNVETDVKFQQTPGPNGAAYTESSVTSNNFDELAGVMSTSSVANNRQLNETVGGMKLLSGAANAISEFDLRIIVETWAEPVLRQTSKLIDYYESDEKALQVAGGKAKTWQRYGIDPTLDEIVATETTLRINIGIGAADPMQRLAKLKTANEMVMPLMELMAGQGIKPNMEAMIDEIYGTAGFKDGQRFYIFEEPEQQQPDPEMVAAMEELKLKNKELEAKVSMNTENNQTKILIEKMDQQQEMMKHMMTLRSNQALAREQRVGRMGEILAGRGLQDRQSQGQGQGRPQQGQGMPPMGMPMRMPMPPVPGMGDNGANARLEAMLKQSAEERHMLTVVLMQLAQAVERMNAPKTILRDQLGKAIGVAPVGPMGGPPPGMPSPGPSPQGDPNGIPMPPPMPPQAGPAALPPQAMALASEMMG